MDRPVERRFWTLGRSFAVGLGLLGFVCLALLARGLGTPTLTVHRERLAISVVEREPFQEFTPVTGNALPREVFFLGTAEGGRVEEVYAEEGDLVGEGEALLKLVNTDLQLEVMRREDLLAEQTNQLVNARLQTERQAHQARRRLAELEHDLLTQRRIHQRNDALHRAGLIPEIDFELSRDEREFLERQREIFVEEEEHNRRFRQQQLKQVEAAVARMRENLALARKKLEKLTIRSPISGRLTSLDAEVGESKAPGDRLGQVDVLDDFKVRAAVDQTYIARVSPGQLAALDLDGETYRLRVNRIYPQVRDGRFEVDLEFEDRLPPGIKRGQTLHLRLMLGEPSDALTLDAGPFYQTTGGRWAYVVAPSGGSASRRPIELGRRNVESYEILNGLEPGDRVVTSSYENLAEYEKLVFEDR